MGIIGERTIKAISGEECLGLIGILRIGDQANLLISSRICSYSEPILPCVLDSTRVVIIHGYLPKISIRTVAITIDRNAICRRSGTGWSHGIDSQYFSSCRSGNSQDL